MYKNLEQSRKLARGIQNYPNISAADSDYPNGRTKDNPGNGTGTPVNLETLGDYQQFFAKLMRIAEIPPNGLPDNEYAGIQYYTALLVAAVPYKTYRATMLQAGTAAPVVTVMPYNSIGVIVWTRSGVGSYQGLLANAFPTNKTFVSSRSIEDTGLAIGFVRIRWSTTGLVFVETYDDTMAPSDDILNDTPVEILAYR